MNFIVISITLTTLLFVSNVEPQRDRSFLDSFNTFFKDSITRLLKGRNTLTKRSQEEPGKPFPCKAPFRPDERPTSVHKLRPGDIDVIAAMGDSLTAAQGAAATSVLGMALESRGLAWSIGGQGTWRQFLTLPNILKEFNPNLVGYSLGDSATIHRESQFNVAEGGSMSRDMPFMAKVLVKRIKADERVNFTHDWKMVTLMIGSNDQCTDSCYHSDLTTWVEGHRRHLTKTLEYLQDNMPRTIVNIITPPDIEAGIKHFRKAIACTLTHIIGCTCMYGLNVTPARRQELTRMMRKWRQVEEEVCQDQRFRTRDDFAVVLQPFPSEAEFPKIDTPEGKVVDGSILSKDCAHFTPKGHALAARGLWNNILEPVGKKSLNYPDWDIFPCPSQESPYIFTWANSGPSTNGTQLRHR